MPSHVSRIFYSSTHQDSGLSSWFASLHHADMQEQQFCPFVQFSLHLLVLYWRKQNQILDLLAEETPTHILLPTCRNLTKSEFLQQRDTTWSFVADSFNLSMAEVFLDTIPRKERVLDVDSVNPDTKNDIGTIWCVCGRSVDADGKVLVA